LSSAVFSSGRGTFSSKSPPCETDMADLGSPCLDFSTISTPSPISTASLRAGSKMILSGRFFSTSSLPSKSWS
ncbi:hypothetical protein PMAYCL1PPCAC_24362, partial [Pristionchus mayeri]